MVVGAVKEIANVLVKRLGRAKDDGHQADEEGGQHDQEVGQGKIKSHVSELKCSRTVVTIKQGRGGHPIGALSIKEYLIEILEGFQESRSQTWRTS